MFKRIFREFYLLPRGEQRALIILSFLLILSLVFRVTVGLLPERQAAGMEEFEQEAALYLAALAEADSLRELKEDHQQARLADREVRADPSFQRRPGSYVTKPIDVNRADTADLLPLPGIGPVFAGRIIKYRDLLGGFVCVGQLGEVYGIPEETVLKIRDRIYIDSSAVRKIRVDSASFRELLRHPYLEYEDVKALIDYRDFKREISSGNELIINNILADSTINKMDGYFDYR